MGTNSWNTESRFPRIPKMALISAWFEPYLDTLLVWGKPCCFLLVLVLNEQKSKKQRQSEWNSRRNKRMQCIKYLIAGWESQFLFCNNLRYLMIFLFVLVGFFPYLMEQMFFLWKPSPYHYLPMLSHNDMLGFSFLMLCCGFFLF